MNQKDRKRFRTAMPLALLKEGRTDWYKIQAATKDANGTRARIDIDGEIGLWGVTAEEFVGELIRMNVDEVDLYLNSPGGEVFDAITMYNALRQHRAIVNVTVNGLAASSASVVAQAGDTITMMRGTRMMVHDGHGMAFGNAAAMTEMALILNAVSDDIASIYAAHAGGTTAEWREVMNGGEGDGTWFSAEEAVEAGLATHFEDSGEPVGNSWDLSVFNQNGGPSTNPKITPRTRNDNVAPLNDDELDTIGDKLDKLLTLMASNEPSTAKVVEVETASPTMDPEIIRAQIIGAVSG